MLRVGLLGHRGPGGADLGGAWDRGEREPGRACDRGEREPGRACARGERGPGRACARGERGPARAYDRGERGPGRACVRGERGPGRACDRRERGPGRAYDREERGERLVSHWLLFLVTGPWDIRVGLVDRGGLEDRTLTPDRRLSVRGLTLLPGPLGAVALQVEILGPDLAHLLTDLVLEGRIQHGHRGLHGDADAGGEGEGEELGRMGGGAPSGEALVGGGGGGWLVEGLGML